MRKEEQVYDVLSDQIARLNDAFRTTLQGGKVLMTSGIATLPAETRASILTAVREFNAFTPDNDPHSEHDFGEVEVSGNRCFWKIDYYDATLEHGSENPGDPAVTTRVLTIMLSNEY
jgi:uncharacterized protein DUF3768